MHHHCGSAAARGNKPRTMLSIWAKLSSTPGASLRTFHLRKKAPSASYLPMAASQSRQQWVRTSSDPLNAPAAFKALPTWQRIVVAERQVARGRSEEHTSELQSLMRISYAVF